MIGSLRGEVLDADRLGGEILVEVGGIGYRILVAPALAISSVVGETTHVHVHHHVREDAELFYGFGSIEERRVFEALISAHGVGPALGLAILSVHDPIELKAVIASEDIDSLCAVPGVGKKTATRLLIELKSKLDLPDVDLTSIGRPEPDTALPAHIEVRQALESLGYTGDDIRSVLRRLPDEGDPAMLTRDALRLIAEGA